MKVKTLNNKLDNAWSELVKLKANRKCEVDYCGKRTLQSHHIFGRRNKTVRWDPMNGVCLCAWHHTLNSKFSAHATPVTFTEWLIKKRGQSEVDLLTYRSHQSSHLHAFERELLLKELLKEIEHFKNLINE